MLKIERKRDELLIRRGSELLKGVANLNKTYINMGSQQVCGAVGPSTRLESLDSADSLTSGRSDRLQETDRANSRVLATCFQLWLVVNR